MFPPVDDPLESWMQEILERGEDTFLSLIQSPLFAEYAAMARHMSDEELRALYGLMITSLRQTYQNMEDQFDSTLEMMEQENSSAASRSRKGKPAHVTLPQV